MKLVYSIVLTVISSLVFGQEIDDIQVVTFEQFKTQMNQETEIVVYNFWATWCKPCVEELPYFETVNKAYRKKGVKVVLVSLDFKRQYYTKVLPFIEDHKIQSEVILLDNGGNNDFIDAVSPKWGGSIPATLIIHNASETYLFYEEQFTSSNQLKELIKPIIEKIK